MTVFNINPAGGQFISAIQNHVDQKLAAAIAQIMDDSRVGILPKSNRPVQDNSSALQALSGIQSPLAPTPFVLAIVEQESDGKHFRVPPLGDDDSYVTVGLDRNNTAQTDQVTSRGYGIGQYTLFHHPPSSQDVANHVADPVRNVRNTYTELRAKFDGFVVGKNGADDRAAEHPQLPLRLCKFPPSDVRYFRDCRNCALGARKLDIERGTPVYRSASLTYQPTQYYLSASYPNTPDRADFVRLAVCRPAIQWQRR